MLTAAASPGSGDAVAEARYVRSARESFDLILLWQESRVGSRAVLEAAQKRLARRAVSGSSPRCERSRVRARPRCTGWGFADLTKAFEKAGLVCDRQARLSAWHVAYRFARPEAHSA